MKKLNFLLASFLLISLGLLSISCSNTNKKPPVDLPMKNRVISIPYNDAGGVKTIPVKVNGITLEMIYDTGCSGVHFSLHELQTLVKNCKFSESDIIRMTLSQIADGSVMENALVLLKEIEIGDKDDVIVLSNIKATVSLNQSAPILLGNNVLDKVASVEVDNINKTINFKRY